MCTVCGCGMPALPPGQAKDGGAHDHHHDGDPRHHHDDHGHDHGHDHHHHGDDHAHDHHHDHGHDHHHDHAHAHDHHHGGGHHHDHHHNHAAPGVAAHTHGEARLLRVERDILSKNNEFARANRARLRDARTFALNFVSSPGSGKTSLLVRTIGDLKARFAITVIEGDQQTSNDAERIRATGVPAVQVNTGKGCHLDAHMIAHALEELAPAPDGLLFIENVGNLICPAVFDLGEAHKVIVLSVTEGEDKPLKYPDMFAAADLMLVNKADLIAHVDFDMATCLANALKVNPRLQTLIVSARTGEGMAALYAWIEARAASLAAAQAAVPQVPAQR